jgi:hypothetical protein
MGGGMDTPSRAWVGIGWSKSVAANRQPWVPMSTGVILGAGLCCELISTKTYLVEGPAQCASRAPIGLMRDI